MIKEVVFEIKFKTNKANLALMALSVDDIEDRDVSIYSELISSDIIRYIFRSSSLSSIGSFKNLFNDLTRCLRVILEL